MTAQIQLHVDLGDFRQNGEASTKARKEPGVPHHTREDLCVWKMAAEMGWGGERKGRSTQGLTD